MKILVRGRSSKHWKVADSVRPDVEAELQDMLHETPSLVPLEEIREGASPLVVAVKEFGLPGSGNTDLLAFSAQGDIAIIHRVQVGYEPRKQAQSHRAGAGVRSLPVGIWISGP